MNTFLTTVSCCAVSTLMLCVFSESSYKHEGAIGFPANPKVIQPVNELFNVSRTGNWGKNLYSDTIVLIPSLGSVLPLDSMINDSVKAQKLEEMVMVNRRLVEIQMSKLGLDSGKVTFETTEEYRKRQAGLERIRDSLVSTDVQPYEHQLKRLSARFYRIARANDARVDMRIENYNADSGIWRMSFIHASEKDDFRFRVDPVKAKEMWRQRENTIVNSLKSWRGPVKDAYELVIEGVGKDTFLLVKKGSDSDIALREKERIDSLTGVSVDASFPGGDKAWTDYLNKELEKNIDELNDEGRFGSVHIIFTVEKDGTITGVRALSCIEAGVSSCLGPESTLAKVLIAAIKKAPKWTPAEYNGRKVRAWRKQTVGFSPS